LAKIARAEQLDFITITDHNTIAGFSELAEHLNYPVIPGIEVTLDKGHFNVFGMGGVEEMDGRCLRES
jgi:predicted metal-dependent phosphoesterase TrpH